MDLLVTVGHLGKDVGAVSPHDFDREDQIVVSQEERWSNLQQVIGFMTAYCADAGPKPNIKWAVPSGYVTNLAFGDALIEVDDEKWTLGERAGLANRLGRWLIEFHNNAAPFEASGAEVIAWSVRSQGYALGRYIMDELARHGIKDRGVKTVQELGRPLALLRDTKAPAIILEGGFLTDKTDASYLDVDLDAWNEQYGLLVYRGVRAFHQSLNG